MKNKDTNTDYQKFVKVGDQKWEVVEITIRIIFFVSRSSSSSSSSSRSRSSSSSSSSSR